MDFSAYKAEAKLGAPADRTDNVRIYNPGADALAREQAKSGAIVLQGIDRLRAEVQTGRVMQANNEYNKELMDLTNELRQNKEQDALNTVEQFDEREQKIRNRIQKKYGSYLYGDAGRKYEEMLNRDYNTRRQGMINYQIGEAEKFNDTTLKNGLMDVTNLATADYMNPANVEGAMNKAAHLVALRYEHYGEEKIKQMTRAAYGQIAQQVIDRAYANGDNDAAETFIERYGRFMDPQALTGYVRNIYQSRMSEIQDVTAKSLYARFKDDEKAAYDFINSEQFGGNGNVDGAIKWYTDSEARGDSLGPNQCTVGLNKALVAGGYKPIHTWAPTAWAEEKEAGRTFTDESRLRRGDIVYWETTGEGVASHVGMYAGNGKVCQSGDSGIRTIPLHEYKIIGFSRPQGKAATPEERKKLWNAYLQEKSMRERWESQAASEMVDETQNRILEYELQHGGDIDEVTLCRIIDTGSMDENGIVNPVAAKKLRGYKNSILIRKQKEAQKAIAENGVDARDIQTMLARGDFSSKESAVNFVLRKIGKADKRNAALKEIDDWEQNKGFFKTDWTGIKGLVEKENPVGRVDSKTFDFMYANALEATNEDIKKYRNDHDGDQPPREVIKNFVINNMAKNIRIGNADYSRAEIKGYGVDYLGKQDGMHVVRYKGTNYYATDAEMIRIRDGENPISVLRGLQG